MVGFTEVDVGPHLERNRNEVSGWHTGGIKTSKPGVNRRMRKQVKGEDTHGKPVGGGVGGERLGLARERGDLDVHRKHNKAEGFYIKKKGNCLPPTRHLFSLMSCSPWAYRKRGGELSCGI